MCWFLNLKMRCHRSFSVQLGLISSFFSLPALSAPALVTPPSAPVETGDLRKIFLNPPDSARPWVMWFVMDGNFTREGIRTDLEAMHQAGIGGVVLFEVNIGVPRGPVVYMSPEWLELMAYAISEAKRLGMEVSLNSGPSWCGTGGPWNSVENSMQNLVSSETTVTGPSQFNATLPQPTPHAVLYGEGTMPPALRQQWRNFYRDETVLAFPTPEGNARTPDIDSKAFYFRETYDFVPRLSTSSSEDIPVTHTVPAGKVVDLTDRLNTGGHLDWQVPNGKWTILRFGRTSTGQVSRPAPDPGIGFQADKLSSIALEKHLQGYMGPILSKLGPQSYGGGSGLTMIHFDSWEMGSQNWTPGFKQEFVTRRGYDPTPYLPVLRGFVVDTHEISERFLWDWRQTVSDLVVEKLGVGLRNWAHRHRMTFSAEAYDMVPGSNLDLAATSDVPMAEFWARGALTDAPSNLTWDRGYGPNLEWSCYEMVSAGHTNGRKVIGAEAFTGMPEEAWQIYPAIMKDQLDWALCAGINKFVMHRFQHQPEVNRLPGMTMGPYGIHWDRTQPWWDVTPAFHRYVQRSSALLRQGVSVADVLYLTPEGAPQVFTPPLTALTSGLPDRKGYNFDGCSPQTFIERAMVKNGEIVFPDGTSYKVLVLPYWPTITPRLLTKIVRLVEEGATIVGYPSVKSPGLGGYREADAQIKSLNAKLWGNPPYAMQRKVGKGRVLLQKAAWDVPLDKARWIWFNEGNPARSAPPGTRFFKKTFTIPHNRMVNSALISLTADNSFELFVNGHKVGDGAEFRQAFTFEIAPYLQTGANEVRVKGFNQSYGGSSPAAMIAALKISLDDGTARHVDSGADWNASQIADGPWTPALDLGPYPMTPWKFDSMPAIYPSYLATRKILSSLKIKPDFDADKPMRYTHRRVGKTDLYFVANRGSSSIRTHTRFRVTGRQPQWWDPITGKTHNLTNFKIAGGVTDIPLDLGAHQSGFVVFDSPLQKTAKALEKVENFPTYQSVKTLTSPWNVTFDPKWGGPAQATFPKLADWSQSPDPNLKHYSGQGVYSTSFDLTGIDLGQGEYRLSLGDVAVAAQVKLNGRQLGSLWCSPWTIDIPRGLLISRSNRLEVTVANLWINRLIGDAGKAPDERFTSTNYNPFQADSPLRPSGLLGPVCVERRLIFSPDMRRQ